MRSARNKRLLVAAGLALGASCGYERVNSVLTSPDRKCEIVVADKFTNPMSLDGTLSIVLKCGWRTYSVVRGEVDWATKRAFAFWREHPREVLVIACGRYSWPVVVNVNIESGSIEQNQDHLKLVREQIRSRFKGKQPEDCYSPIDALYWGCCEP